MLPARGSRADKAAAHTPCRAHTRSGSALPRGHAAARGRRAVVLPAGAWRPRDGRMQCWSVHRPATLVRLRLCSCSCVWRAFGEVRKTTCVPAQPGDTPHVFGGPHVGPPPGFRGHEDSGAQPGSRWVPGRPPCPRPTAQSLQHVASGCSARPPFSLRLRRPLDMSE